MQENELSQSYREINQRPSLPWNFITHTHLFSRARKKGFSFFSRGATPSRTVPKTQPLEVAFSLLERVDLRSQKDRILGKKIAWGRVGWTGQKKEKRMRKKRWADRIMDPSAFPDLFVLLHLYPKKILEVAKRTK